MKRADNCRGSTRKNESHCSPTNDKARSEQLTFPLADQVHQSNSPFVIRSRITFKSHSHVIIESETLFSLGVNGWTEQYGLGIIGTNGTRGVDCQVMTVSRPVCVVALWPSAGCL